MKQTGSHGEARERVTASEAGGRVLRSNSTALLMAVATMVGLIIVISALLSFQAQMELAAHSGIPEMVSWGWPLIVDGTVIVGTAAVLVLTPRGRAKAAYAWFVLGIFGLVTVAANGIHATGIDVPMWARFGVGAVPAVALLLSTHLFVLMLTSPEVQIEPVIVKKRIIEIDDDTEAAGRSGLAVDSVVSARASEPAGPVSPELKPAPVPAMSVAEVEAWIIEQVTATGVLPSGQAVGDKLGKSRSAGSRVRRELASRNMAVAEALGVTPMLRKVGS